MLIAGKEKLDRMRDGRVIYIGAELVKDVTYHPAGKRRGRDSTRQSTSCSRGSRCRREARKR